jgi:hypothetical protein
MDRASSFFEHPTDQQAALARIRSRPRVAHDDVWIAEQLLGLYGSDSSGTELVERDIRRE